MNKRGKFNAKSQYFSKVISSKKILAIHGTHDEIININLAKQSYEKYKINKNFILKEYKMGHEVIEEEILDVRDFLLRD